MWYFFRILLFGLAGLVVWRLLTPPLGSLNGLLFTLLLATPTFWGDVIARLGPGETYPVLGLALYTLAFVRLVHLYRQSPPQATGSRGYWVLFAASAIVCGGSKENLTILLVPTASLWLYLASKRRLDAPAWVGLAFTAAVLLLVGASVGTVVLQRGQDVYGTTAQVEQRGGKVSAGLLSLFQDRTWLLTFSGGLLALGGSAAWLALRHNPEAWRQWRRAAQDWVVTLVGLVSLWVSQYVFYAGDWPRGNRYDFPGLLAIPLLGLVTLLLAQALLRLVTPAPRLYAVLQWTAGIVVLGLIAMNGYGAARQASAQNAAGTRLLQANLDSVQTTLSVHPNAALLLVSHRGLDFEGLFSVSIQLQARGVQNPTFLRFEPKPDQASYNAYDALLAVEVRALAEGQRRTSYFAPGSELPPGPCFSLTFSDDYVGPCTLLARIN